MDYTFQISQSSSTLSHYSHYKSVSHSADLSVVREGVDGLTSLSALGSTMEMLYVNGIPHAGEGLAVSVTASTQTFGDNSVADTETVTIATAGGGPAGASGFGVATSVAVSTDGGLAVSLASAEGALGGADWIMSGGGSAEKLTIYGDTTISTSHATVSLSGGASQHPIDLYTADQSWSADWAF